MLNIPHRPEEEEARRLRGRRTHSAAGGHRHSFSRGVAMAVTMETSYTIRSEFEVPPTPIVTAADAYSYPGKRALD